MARHFSSFLSKSTVLMTQVEEFKIEKDMKVYIEEEGRKAEEEEKIEERKQI